MHPHLFSLGTIHLSAYGLLLVMGFGVAYPVARRLAAGNTRQGWA